MLARGHTGLVDPRRSERPLLVLCCVIGTMLAVLGAIEAGVVTADGHGLILFCLIPVAVPFLFWRFEEAGLLLLVVAAGLIEQFPVLLGPDSITDGTSTVPLFTSLSSGAGLSSVNFNPAELLLTLVVLIWALRAALNHDIHLPRSQMARALWVMLGVVAVAYVVGLAHGGNQRIALIELRPWIYLAVAFILGARLLRTRRALDALLWALVLCAGIKAGQTVYLLALTHSLQPAPEALVGHEDSLFFAMALMITLGLWLYGIRGRLRATATALVPLILLADLGNHRRAAWVILGAGITVMLIIAYTRLPERRRAIRWAVAITAIMAAGYVPAFWNDEGTLGQPARAVRSVIAPSARDQGSDLYRKLEDANLGINIHNTTPFGAGFGVPINYVVPIIDISTTDSLILYVPHDGVLYVWMRMGWPGILAFWAFIASAIFAATRLAKVADPRLAMLGALGAGTVVGYVILGYQDLGLFWYRVAIIMGALLGALHSAQAMAAESPEAAPATAATPVAPAPAPLVRGGARIGASG